MIKIQFNEQDPDKLYYNFLREEHHKVRLKNLVLYCKSQKMSHSKILEFCKISEPTLASYLKEFATDGFDVFKRIKWKGQKSKLNEYIDIIGDDFSKTPPKSAIEAQNRIEKLTGIRRSPTQIRSFMKEKLDYKFLKSGSLPGNGKDDDHNKELEREEFKKKDSNPCWIKLEKKKK